MRILLLTAIEEEYLKSRSFLENIQEISLDGGNILEEGVFQYENEKINVVIAKTGMGNIKSGIFSATALAKIKPDFLFYIGIAGGIKDVKIGDVVVAEKFYYFENGKAREKFSARPESGNSLYRIVQKAAVQSRKNDWKNLSSNKKNENKVIIGNICSGEKVIASTGDGSSYHPYEIIKSHYSDSHAVDMESGGIIASSWINSYSNIVIIRGISDLLVQKDVADSDGSRILALDNAFAFGFHLIGEIVLSEKPKVSFVITLNANEEILHNSDFNRILIELRKLSGDDSLSFRFSSTGSINLHLTCSNEGFEMLKHLFNKGVLIRIEGYQVLDVLSDEEAIQNNKFEIDLGKYLHDSDNDIFNRITKDYVINGLHRKRAHGYFAFPMLEGEVSNRMIFRNKQVIVWSINNYLGLANLPEVRAADGESALKFGVSAPMGARMLSGNTILHEKLEKELAEFSNKEDALLLNYGYQGMLSIIDVLCSRHDVIVYDAESHPCIIDGVRLHPGHRYVFKHNDLEDCEKQLQRATALVQKQKAGGVLVITEGVFGMLGDQGRLRGITILKNKYNFRILINDSHGFGTLGKTGAGTGEEQGVQDEIDLYFSSFSKAMASVGAFVAGDSEIIDYIRYNIRSQVFSKSLPSIIVAGNLKRLEIIKKQPELKEKLWNNVRKLQSGLKQKHFDIGSTNSLITPIILEGQVDEATAMAIDLRENFKILTSVIVYPVIPKGHIIFRLIPTAVHTDEDIELTIQAFIEAKLKLVSGLYKPETQDEFVDLAQPVE